MRQTALAAGMISVGAVAVGRHLQQHRQVLGIVELAPVALGYEEARGAALAIDEQAAGSVAQGPDLDPQRRPQWPVADAGARPERAAVADDDHALIRQDESAADRRDGGHDRFALVEHLSQGFGGLERHATDHGADDTGSRQ